jgi:hypothetical protein
MTDISSPGSSSPGSSSASTAAPPPPEWARGTTLVFTDGEPDDLEFFLLLALMLKDVQPKPKFVIVAGGASVDVSVKRLNDFFYALHMDGLDLDYEMVRGMSDPLNAKRLYCKDFLDDMKVDKSQRNAVQEFLEMANSFGTAEKSTIEELKTRAAEKAALGFEGWKALRYIREGCDVVCIKKPDELVALASSPLWSPLWNAERSNIWFYAGGYNIEPPKHGGGAFHDDLLRMLTSFKACVILSAFVVIKGRGKRDVLALQNYKPLLRESQLRSAELLRSANVQWSASMLEKWLAESKVALRDVESVDDRLAMTRDIQNSSMKDFRKSACLNILEDPAYQRVIADQLLALLLDKQFPNTKVQSGSLEWKEVDGKNYLTVNGRGAAGNNAFEVVNIGAETNLEALSIIDDAMTECLHGVAPVTHKRYGPGRIWIRDNKHLSPGTYTSGTTSNATPGAEPISPVSTVSAT